LQAKFKYICIEQNRKYLYSVVITKTGRKSNLQRSHWWYSTQHRNMELYSCISFESRQFFKRIFSFKQINVITGGPLGAEGPGQLTPSIRPWILGMRPVRHGPQGLYSQGALTWKLAFNKVIARAALSKCGARLEAILRGPTQWRVQKFLSIKW